MIVERICSATRLAELAADWEHLVPTAPMLGPRWLLPWWRHYGDQGATGDPARQLNAMALFDPAHQLVALAPWFIETTRLHDRVVRFLGVGEVCTDYLAIPCLAGRQLEVARFLADALLADEPAGGTDRTVARGRRWDMLDFSGVDSECPVMRALLGELENRGALVRRGLAAQGWRIALPATWEEYLARLSKSHRKQLRRIGRRMLGSERLRLREVQGPAELSAALEILAHLHRRRRHSVGDPDLFARERFVRFHRDATQALLAGSRLRLCWLELDGAPVAAEYQVCGTNVVYAYQSGIDPGHLRAEPGRLAMMATIKAAIERGDQAFDFMRGDEPYKAHWRAEPRPMLTVRVWPGTAADWVRQGLWQAGQRMRAIVRDCRMVAGL
jgi:hypothetical protein